MSTQICATEWWVVNLPGVSMWCVASPWPLIGPVTGAAEQRGTFPQQFVVEKQCHIAQPVCHHVIKQYHIAQYGVPSYCIVRCAITLAKWREENRYRLLSCKTD